MSAVTWYQLVCIYLYDSMKLSGFLLSFESDLFDVIFVINPLTPGVHGKIIHTHTNLQLSAADLFKFI